LNELNISANVEQLTVNDEQLTALYQGATAFVYPSLYEGFGLPVLEAFANNCPVILSNASALPEVAGDAAEYFNPGDEQSIALSIDKVLNSIDKQNDLGEKGKERLKLFSFDKCLQKTVQVYYSLT
jgi:glycosyltransferase involved in cell wall biosynthesis